MLLLAVLVLMMMLMVIRTASASALVSVRGRCHCCCGRGAIIRRTAAAAADRHSLCCGLPHGRHSLVDGVEPTCGGAEALDEARRALVVRNVESHWA